MSEEEDNAKTKAGVARTAHRQLRVDVVGEIGQDTVRLVVDLETKTEADPGIKACADHRGGIDEGTGLAQETTPAD